MRLWETKLNHPSRGPNGALSATVEPSDRTWLIVGAAIVFFMLMFGALIALALARSDAVYAEFMDGCERDHKHYECMLLWRASRRDDATVVPIPVPIPVPR